MVISHCETGAVGRFRYGTAVPFCTVHVIMQCSCYLVLFHNEFKLCFRMVSIYA